MGDIGPKIQTSNYKMSKFQRPNIYHDEYTYNYILCSWKSAKSASSILNKCTNMVKGTMWDDGCINWPNYHSI